MWGVTQRTGMSQKPARHRLLQHSPAVVHPAPTAWQMGIPPSPGGGGGATPPSVGGGGGGGGSGASQLPFEQLEVQHWAPVVQGPAAGMQGVVHVFEAGSQWAPQQSASTVHTAFCPRHAPGGRPQRPLMQRSFLSVAPQQPDCGPFPQSSPVGRQVEFGRSTSHCFVVGLQTPEQHSAFAAQTSPTI
jgi:hypothetical protein